MKIKHNLFLIFIFLLIFSVNCKRIVPKEGKFGQLIKGNILSIETTYNKKRHDFLLIVTNNSDKEVIITQTKIIGWFKKSGKKEEKIEVLGHKNGWKFSSKQSQFVIIGLLHLPEIITPELNDRLEKAHMYFSLKNNKQEVFFITQ